MLVTFVFVLRNGKSLKDFLKQIEILTRLFEVADYGFKRSQTGWVFLE